MKTLERYILAEFTKLLVISFLTFILLFTLVDLFENMDNLMKNRVPFMTAARYFTYKVPFIIGQISPIAMLLSVLLSLGIFSKHGEITAIKAGGISLLRLLVPLFIYGAVLSGAMVFMNETVIPASSKKAESIKKLWFKELQASSFGKEGIWIRTNDAIVNIKQMDLKTNTLHGVTVYYVAKPFAMKSRVQSRMVSWKDNRWVADDASVWNFTGTGIVDRLTASNLTIDGLAPPLGIANVEEVQKNMSISELYRYIKNLEAEGYDTFKYSTELYGRLTFPAVNFIMVFVGIPFALRSGRHGSIASGVGVSIIIAFCYWVVFAVTKSLGSRGIIPPVLAASFPDVLFFAVGALMLGYVKQ